jgi:hypothetical protein
MTRAARQDRAASNGGGSAYTRARARRLARSPDRYVRATSRFAERGLDVCDCPCHWWPGAREAVACCPNRGLRWAGDGFVPFSDDQEGS